MGYHRQRRADQGGRDLGQYDHPPAVEAIGGRPGPGRQHDEADELGEADHGHEKRGPRETEHQDRHGDVLDPSAHARQEIPDEVAAEVPPAQHAEGRDRSAFVGNALAIEIHGSRPGGPFESPSPAG